MDWQVLGVEDERHDDLATVSNLAIEWEYFMAIGLPLSRWMVVYFGRFGDGMEVVLPRCASSSPNASGIFKGASVLLAGAKVGMVESSSGDSPGHERRLSDVEDLQGRGDSQQIDFPIGSSGLLGDRFIQIDCQGCERLAVHRTWSVI